MKTRRRDAIFKLILPAFLALMPLLLLGGGMNGSVQAGAPISANPPSTRSDSLVLRVYFRDAAERDRLATELAAEEADISGGYLTVWTDRATYNDLLARGLRVEIDEKQTKEANTPIIWGNTFYGGYRTVEEMQTFLDQKAAAYPTLAEKIDIGDSWCKTHPGQCTQPNSWNGFDLYVMHITNRAIPGPKPVFWFDAGIHSREIATPEVAMNYIAWLLDNYSTNADARWIVDHQDIWVMPMLNPDGHHMNESGGEGTPTSHRRNADRDDGCPNYDFFGTDINRNFNFKWACCGGSSSDPCNDTYRGPAPDSEEETQGVLAKVRALIPDQRGPLDTDVAPITTTGTLVNMHSNAQLNIHPWGWTTIPAPNYNEMNNIGRRMGATASYGGNQYRSCQSLDPNCLYTVDGDEKNWAYGELGIPAYSVEVHGNGFFPTFATTTNDIWPRNRGAMTYMAKIARTPYLQTRGPDANTETVIPVTVNQGDTAQITATIKYDWPAPSYNQPNRYLQNVAAAEFYVDTPPWNGGTPIAMTATDGSFDQPTEAVVGSLPTGSLTPGRHVIFVRGRGVNDYQGYQSWGPIGGVFVDVQAGGGCTPSNEQVNIQDFLFNPQNLTVAVGSTVQWTNLDSSPHTSTSAGNWDSGNLNQNQSFSHTFNAVGTFNYVCTYHPAMTGTITVIAACTPTVVPPTSTSTVAPPTITNTVVPSPTSTVVSTASPTPEPPVYCTFYQDVPPGHPDYNPIICAGCRGVMGGFPCGSQQEPCVAPENYPYFRPAVVISVTRGETARFISRAAGFNEPRTGQIFEDVPPSHPDYAPIERMAARGHMTGYACGGPGEPCLPPEYRPYFRPNSTPTRSQFAKILSNTAGFAEPPSGQTFEDVVPSNTFYEFIERLANRNIMRGFPCGGPGEPCYPPQNRPYFRPFNVMSVPRAELARIIMDTFYPGCQTLPSLTPTVVPTIILTSTPVPTTCPITFSDVPSTNTFYANIRCLACRGIVSGYSDGTFRPNNQVTRGQLAKIVSNSAGFSEPVTGRTFEDVPPSNTFYEWIERLTTRGYMTGYTCGGVGEPCTTGRPYFRPFSNATRGQTAKIVANAAMFTEPPVGQTFEDVPPTHTFYEFIQRLATRNVMQGYPCGSVGEPCTTGRPYFRPGNDVTRGQSAKIVANTFYPDCVTP